MKDKIDKKRNQAAEREPSEHSPEQGTSSGQIPNRIQTAYGLCYGVSALIGSIGGFIGLGSDHNGIGAGLILLSVVIFGVGATIHVRATTESEKQGPQIDELKEIKDLLAANNEPNVTVEDMPIVLTQNQSPLVILHIFNHGNGTAKDFFGRGFYVVHTLDFDGTLNYPSEGIGDPVDVPGKTKMSINITWPRYQSLEEVMAIKNGRLRLFIYIDTNYVNSAEVRVTCVKGYFLYDPQLKALIVAPKLFWPTDDQD